MHSNHHQYCRHYPTRFLYIILNKVIIFIFSHFLLSFYKLYIVGLWRWQSRVELELISDSHKCTHKYIILINETSKNDVLYAQVQAVCARPLFFPLSLKMKLFDGVRVCVSLWESVVKHTSKTVCIYTLYCGTSLPTV